MWRDACLVLSSLLVALATGCPDIPVIVIQPKSQTVEAGKTATFSCVAIGAWPMSYQWKKDGTALTAAQLATFTTAPLNDMYEGDYTCEISNSYGSTESSAATLTVTPSTTSEEYLSGLADGLANDEWYWKGFDDGLNTLTVTTIHYQGNSISNPDSPDYDHGYYDGVWYAYNDGYFVCYDYAFAIGFSEGYDAAFYWDYLDFLQGDGHVEYKNGGWADGYNDGFSEGRVFGAYDYENGSAWNWLNAMEAYRSGTDRNFADIGVGTRSYGPVTFYTYGINPSDESTNSRGLATASHAVSYRELTSTESKKFNKTPTSALRSEHVLTFTTTWLQRLNAYRATVADGK